MCLQETLTFQTSVVKWLGKYQCSVPQKKKKNQCSELKIRLIHQQPLKVTSGVFDNLEKLRPYGFGSGARSKTGTPSIIAIGWLQHFDINSEGF